MDGRKNESRPERLGKNNVKKWVCWKDWLRKVRREGNLEKASSNVSSSTLSTACEKDGQDTTDLLFFRR